MSAQIPDELLLVGDVRVMLDRLPEHSIDTVITSPPYFWLRDYHVDGQIGQEAKVELWVEELRLAFRGLARVLKPQGSVWINVADSFSRHQRYGAPPKSLLLGPEKLALALSRDGWIVRNRVAWTKPNPMPNSVADRLNTTWEFVYFLTRSPKYYFNLDAIRIPHSSAGRPINGGPSLSAKYSGRPTWAGPLAGSQSGLPRLKERGLPGHPLGKNPGDNWHIATAGFKGMHFATFPEKLVERPLLATCPERVCRACGLAWSFDIRRHQDARPAWQPGCSCGASWQPGVVLDPFFGSGTVGVVAEKHGRRWCGIELSSFYAKIAQQRIEHARGSPKSEQADAA